MKIRINRTLKLSLLVILTAGFMLGLKVGEKNASAYSGGPPASRTGAPAFGAIPAEQTCATSGCHIGTNNLNDGLASFAIKGPVSYVPGQTYTITVSLKRGTNMPTAGFQLTALDSAGSSIGTLADAVANSTITFTTTGSVGTVVRSYIEHQTSAYPTDVAGSGQADWKIKWTAPPTRSGKITFYAAGNAANGGGSNGDFIYTTSAAMTPDVVTQNSASGTTSDLTPNGIGSAYGIELATQTATATDTDPNAAGIQLPTTLGGTTVTVKDSVGTTRTSALFFVSPGQVNYQIPNGTASGVATVTITNGSGGQSTGSVTIASVAPGVFTVNQNGAGLAAAEVQRVAGQVQTFEATAQFTGGAWVAIPIDWKNQTDSLYLVIYGTGIRNLSALTTVNLKVGNTTFTNLPAVYAGSQNFFVGVDQVNIFLPRSLIGSGLVDAVLTVDGKNANTFKLNFK